MTSPQPYCLLTPRPFPSLISIVIPAFNEQDTVPLLRHSLSAFLQELPCEAEIIIVNDGSRDATLPRLLEWADSDPRVRVIALARNFGHQAAATAGLDHASGDAVVLMDADLQDPPDVISGMLVEYCKGYDVVYGQRISRAGETVFKRASAWAFYRLMRFLVHSALPLDTGDFRLISRRCMDALCKMRETHRFLRGMVAWVGFPQIAVRYERRARAAGSTNYSLRQMLSFAFSGALSFSPAPMRMVLLFGILIAGFGLAEGVYAVIRVLLGLYVVPGWSSLIVVFCLIGGAILISIGILGEYIARVFEEVKGRPIYIVAERTNFPVTGEPAHSIPSHSSKGLADDVR